MPELLDGPFQHSILKRAAQKGLAEVHLHQLRHYGVGKHQQVDDYQYGGGAGMVMQCEPLVACIEDLQSQHEYEAILYMTPDGKRFNQSDANRLSLMGNMMIICGHYKGIDQRVRDHWVTHEYSIGDFVLSGGELAAAVITDAVIRLLPGVLNDETSALTDSFQDDLLAPPVYTRPEEFRGHRVPDILLSGNTKAIEVWREEQAYKRTKERRPDLLGE
ncbi:MAG: hypothetical protein RL754_1230 [Bacteroidota bacterium]